MPADPGVEAVSDTVLVPPVLAVTPVPELLPIAVARLVAIVVVVVETPKFVPVLEPADPPPKTVNVALTCLLVPLVCDSV